MKIKIGLLISTFWLASCSTLQIVSDFDKEANFSEFRTFSISEPRDIDYQSDPRLNQLNLNRLTRAIKQEMMLRGYSESKNPDLTINIFAKITPKAEILKDTSPYLPYRGYYRYYGYRGYYNYWGSGWNYAETAVVNYKEGTLVIDIVDNDNEKLVWQGVAIKTLQNVTKNPEARINALVTQIFEKYPYIAGSNIPMNSIQ